MFTGNMEQLIDPPELHVHLVVPQNSPVNNDGDETRTFIGLSGISNFHSATNERGCLFTSLSLSPIYLFGKRHYWLTKFPFWAIIFRHHLRNSFGTFPGLARHF